MQNSHLQSVAKALPELGLKFTIEENRLKVGFEIDDGEFVIFIHTYADDAILIFDARGFIRIEEVQKSKHSAAFAVYLLHRNWQTAGGSFEMDCDGEVSLTLEIPMADAQVTVQQVKLVFELMLSQIKAVRVDGREVLETGKLTASSSDSESRTGSELNRMAQLHKQMRDLLSEPEGREALTRLAHDSESPEEVRVLAKLVLATAAPDEL